MKDQLLALAALQTKANTVFQPVFYRLTDKQQKEEFEKLLTAPGIILVDYIWDQLKELIKYKNPSRKFSTNDLETQTKNYLGDRLLHEYGVWVFYPWSNRLVHILDRDEFIDLRTSRNQNKITRAERDILATKKIGVIGLSVGQSVSVTLAMERICGELRLADFDILEITNLNRIRTGIHNLGLPKVYSVAREVAEIDPFIKVLCFPMGLSDENMDEFFTTGGNLDLLIEESDGFDIKITSRYKARSLKIPVLMEGSDRCLVDVERFDLQPNRSILHGLVDHLDVNMLKNLKTNEEKIPYMLDVLGLDTSSLRLKASMLEIEQSINTWPQLASAVTMGGGITADVARRVLLNSYTDSGRYHVDIEELIGNKTKVDTGKEELTATSFFDFKSVSESLKIEVKPAQVNLSKKEVTDIVEAGCKAPSGGNAQPWRFAYHNQSLMVFNGMDAGNTFLGFGNLASYVAIGAAIENVVVQSSNMGLDARVDLFPVKNIPELVAVLSFFKASKANSNHYLMETIGQRLTNRKLGARQHIEQTLLDKYQARARETQGVDLRFFTSSGDLDAIGNLLGELEKLRLLEKDGHRDFVAEIRWTKEENDEKRDGVDFRTLDLSNTEKVGMQVSRDERIMQLLNQWDGGGAFKKLTKKSIDAAGAVGFLFIDKSDNAAYVKGGMALERIWLECTANGIAFQPMAASVFTYARLLKGDGIGISEKGRKRLHELRPQFEKLFGLSKNSTEIFIFRLSLADKPEIMSLRKPLEELFCYF